MGEVSLQLYDVEGQLYKLRHSLTFCCFSIGSPSIGTNRFQEILSFFGRAPASESVQRMLNGFCRSIVHHLHVGEAKMFLPSTISVKRYNAKTSTLSLAP